MRALHEACRASIHSPSGFINSRLSTTEEALRRRDTLPAAELHRLSTNASQQGELLGEPWHPLRAAIPAGTTPQEVEPGTQMGETTAEIIFRTTRSPPEMRGLSMTHGPVVHVDVCSGTGMAAYAFEKAAGTLEQQGDIVFSEVLPEAITLLHRHFPQAQHAGSALQLAQDAERVIRHYNEKYPDGINWRVTIASPCNDHTSASPRDRLAWIGSDGSAFLGAWCFLWQLNAQLRVDDRLSVTAEMVSTQSDLARRFMSWALAADVRRVNACQTTMMRRSRDIVSTCCKQAPETLLSKVVPHDLPVRGWTSALLGEIGGRHLTLMAPRREVEGLPTFTTSQYIRSNLRWSGDPHAADSILASPNGPCVPRTPGDEVPLTLEDIAPTTSDWDREELQRFLSLWTRSPRLQQMCRPLALEEREYLMGIPVGWCADANLTLEQSFAMVGRAWCVTSLLPLFTWMEVSGESRRYGYIDLPTPREMLAGLEQFAQLSGFAEAWTTPSASLAPYVAFIGHLIATPPPRPLSYATYLPDFVRAAVTDPRWPDERTTDESFDQPGSVDELTVEDLQPEVIIVDDPAGTPVHADTPLTDEELQIQYRRDLLSGSGGTLEGIQGVWTCLNGSRARAMPFTQAERAARRGAAVVLLQLQSGPWAGMQVVLSMARFNTGAPAAGTATPAAESERRLSQMSLTQRMTQDAARSRSRSRSRSG